MCKKTQFRYCPSTIDKCLRKLIRFLQDSGIETVGCCCGHGKYPTTILIKHFSGSGVWDIMSDTLIPRRRNFYKKDKQGYYFIPEVSSQKSREKN